MNNEDIAGRLDRLIGILQLAHHDEIEHARTSIRGDEVNAAILDLAAKEESVRGGKLVAAVRQKLENRHSPKTVQRRIATLLEMGALEKLGDGPTTAYKATGLV